MVAGFGQLGCIGEVEEDGLCTWVTGCGSPLEGLDTLFVLVTGGREEGCGLPIMATGYGQQGYIGMVMADGYSSGVTEFG